MKKLTELYNELLSMRVNVFSGCYHLSGSCDSTVVRLGDQYGIFLDIDRIRTARQELEAVSHEWAHVVTGTTYNLDAPEENRQKAETRAKRAQIQRLLPYDALSSAMKEGDREVWQLAEKFDVSEDLIRQAVDYYTGPCGLSF